MTDLSVLAERGRKLCRDLGITDTRNQGGTNWYRIFNADDAERAELWIYGAIGDDLDPDDVTAGSFARELGRITAPAIDLHINSPGGLVFDGIAIHAALRNHPATVNVTVDGVAASAASFIAMAGDDVAVEKPAKMMIHDASSLTIGNAEDHRERAEFLDEVSQTIAQIYADRAGGDAETWRERMRATTWFSSAEAVDAGLADRVIGSEPAAPARNKSPAVAVPAPREHSHAAAWNLDKSEKGSSRMGIEEILAAMKGIIDGAEGRPLSDDEVKRYEALEVDLANKRTEAVKERQHAYEAPAPSDAAAAMSAHVAPKKRDDGIEQAFNHYLRTGKPNADISELQVTNAQSVGTGSEGGFTAPEGFRQKLVDRLRAFGGLANEAEVITTETGNRLPWPTLDDTSNTGEIAAENAAPTGGSDLVFGEKELNAYRYTAPGANADPLRVSVELLQDSAFDIESLVIRKLGERIARVQAQHWATGTGTGEPEGITQSTGASQVFAGAAPTKDELIDAIHSVDPDYRMNAVWVFNDATLGEIRKLEDANGRPLLLGVTEGIGSDMGGFTLLGHRVVIDQAFANYSDVSGNTWGVFGDILESYVIRRVRDVQVVVNPWTRANNGQVEYTLWSRGDGAIQNQNSVSLLVNDAV